MNGSREHFVQENETCLTQNVDKPASIVVLRSEELDGNTSTSDLASVASSRVQKSGEFILIADWVRKCLFKYCKFVTNRDSVEYGQPLSLFCLEENNIMTDKQIWWKANKRVLYKH